MTVVMAFNPFYMVAGRYIQATTFHNSIFKMVDPLCTMRERGF